MNARVRRREKVKEVPGIFNEIVLQEAHGCYTFNFFFMHKDSCEADFRVAEKRKNYFPKTKRQGEKDAENK